MSSKVVLSNGYEVEELKEEEFEEYKKVFQGATKGLVRVKPTEQIFPIGLKKFGEKIFNFEFRPSDVVVMTYPKCGTTWMQEIVWTMLFNPNLDNPDAKQSIFLRSPQICLDFTEIPIESFPPAKELLFPGRDVPEFPFLHLSNTCPNPRVLKTHYPFTFWNNGILDTSKVVYVVRNPKDVCVSFFHFCVGFMVLRFSGDFNQFLDYFLQEKIRGSYTAHVKEAAERRHHPNLLIISFEELKNNTLQELARLNKFLGTSLTEEQLQRVAKHTSFSEMKNRENSSFSDVLASVGVEGFFRKGKAGDWKNMMNDENQKKINSWIERHFSEFPQYLPSASQSN